MKKTSTLNKLSMTVALLIGYATCATAQTTTNTSVKPATSYRIAETTGNQSGIDAKGSAYGTLNDKEQNASYPWFNYKGFANIEEAKLQWIQDNPAAYKEMLESANKNNPK